MIKLNKIDLNLVEGKLDITTKIWVLMHNKIDSNYWMNTWKHMGRVVENKITLQIKRFF